MSVFAGVAGSGAGIVTIAAAFLLARHLHRAHQCIVPWLARAAAVLMFCGGSAIAVTAAGQWVITFVTGLTAPLGGVQSGLAFASLTAMALFTAIGVLTDMVWAPGNGLVTAAVLPLVLGLTHGGILHALYVHVVIPAGGYASVISGWLGG